MNIVDKAGIQAFNALIDACSKISIVAHLRPDGDALGSTLAMLHYLLRRRKDAMAVYSDILPRTLSFMTESTGRDRFIEFPVDEAAAESRISSSDLVVCLDCNSFGRTGALEPFLRCSDARKVLIDHHQNPDTQNFDVVFSREDISSASELLYYVLMAMPDVDGVPSRLPDKSLPALMTGLTTDTNNFANSVFPSTWTMASGLLEAGVDRDSILMHLYQSSRESRIRMWGYMLYNNLKITDYGVAYMIMDSKIAGMFNVQEGETEGLVNEPLKIADVRMSIFLKQDEDGYFRVSLRSKKGTSASKFAVGYFHGGGHENASGGRIYYRATNGCPADMQSPEDVERFVLACAANYFRVD